MSNIQASSITWTLQDVIFASGQTASGTFIVDQELETMIDWEIRITGGDSPILTNIVFRPGGTCVAFCGSLRAVDFFGAQSGMFVRTALAPDNTMFELNLYFYAPLRELVFPGVASRAVHRMSNLNYSELIDPRTIHGLQYEELSTSTEITPRVVTSEAATIPEPGTLFTFGFGMCGVALIRNRVK